MKFKPGSFRFFLALVVAVYHVAGSLFFGVAAVYAFFILSGYWVTKMYVEKYKNLNGPVLTFYTSRLLRLYPAYLFITFLALIVNSAFELHKYDFFSMMSWFEKTLYILSTISLVGYNQWTTRILSPAWSLDIELQFYFLIPLIVHWITVKNLVPILFLSILLSTGLFFWDIAYITDTFVQYAPFFLIGIGIYYLPSYKIDKYAQYSVVATVLFIGICYLYSYLFKVKLTNTAFETKIFCAVVPILLIPFISNNVKQKSSGIDMTLGNISYVLYLLHRVVISIYDYYFHNVSGIQKVVISCLYLSTALLLSYVVYIYIDNPFNEFRKRFSLALGTKNRHS